MNTFVVLPTYNERANIGEVVSRLFALPLPLNILVVDDNSPDGTAGAVKSLQQTYPRLDLLVRTEERGFGTAYLAGFRHVMNIGAADSILMMDSDLSHNPAHIPAMQKQLQTCDVVIGSRYVEGGGVAGWELWRRVLSRAGNTYIRANTRLPFRDCTSGFNLIRTSVLRDIDASGIASSGYAFLVELKYILWRSGARITEVPITFLNRAEGESKLSGHIIREAVTLPWKLRARRAPGSAK